MGSSMVNPVGNSVGVRGEFSPFRSAVRSRTVESMTATLHIQPNNPALASNLSLSGAAMARSRRPVRARSLACALAVGALIGGLISMSAASDGDTMLTGPEIKTEVIAP